MTFIDIWVEQYITAIRSLPFTEYMHAVTMLFDKTPQIVLILVFSILIYRFRGSRYVALFIGTTALGAVAVYLLKEVFAVSRPADAVLFLSDPSFPSWHATSASLMFVMLMYIFDDYFTGIHRKLFNFLCICMIFLVGFSRVYLGVHWFSDVVAGIILGGVIAFLAISFFKRYVVK